MGRYKAAHSIDAFIESEVHHSMSTSEEPPMKIRKILNRLYNVTVEFEIPSVNTFRVNAILDTGATACCICKEVVPDHALEPLSNIVYFNGVNSQQPAKHKIKSG